MTDGLSFPDPPTIPTGPLRRLRWLPVVAVLLCVTSIVILTLLVPSRESYPPKGGFLPITSQGSR